MGSEPRHVVAVVGGAVAGSVAAEILAERGCVVVVFEKNERPYGKIEDGLPRWHSKQRRLEYANIDARLDRPSVHLVPRTRLGADLSFADLTRGWGFSAVLLANGAWRDRPLDLPGGEDFVGRGLVYQNPFIHWFNHKDESGYAGPRLDVPDGALVVGGGLASLDVMKVVQLELYGRALRARGIEVDMHHLEHAGIRKVCAERGIADPRELGVEGGLLVYRRRVEDMPLHDDPRAETPEHRARLELTRRKILEKCQEKYLFRFEARRLPVAGLVEDGRLVGLRLAETAVEGRRAVPIAGTERDVRAALTIGSIGSVPEKIPGILMKGDAYAFKDRTLGEYAGAEGVYALGNVVTGKGNIRDSLLHGRAVARHVVERYLGIAEGPRDLSPALLRQAEASARAATAVAQRVVGRPKLPAEKVDLILARVRKRQRDVGYEGDYKTWISKVTPADLE